MAERHGEVTAYQPSRAPAYLALASLALALALGFLPVLRLGVEQGFAGLDPYILRVLSFTLLQAGLSTLLSIALGLPLARALARRQDFPGRGLIIRLLNLPLALPAIVVIIGIIEVYGAKGWLGGIVDIYGLPGILLAHVFFNAPLAARLILSDIERIRGIRHHEEGVGSHVDVVGDIHAVPAKGHPRAGVLRVEVATDVRVAREGDRPIELDVVVSE